MSEQLHRQSRRIPPAPKGISGRGGPALAAFEDSSCFYGYYNPSRYYHLRTDQVNGVLEQNNADLAQRARLPIYYTEGAQDDGNDQNADIFYTDECGLLSELLKQNMSGLCSAMVSRGFWEVMMSFSAQGVNGPHWTKPEWQGSLYQWNAENDRILQMNLNFTGNLLDYVFAVQNSAGLYMVSDLGGELFPPYDTDCANYEDGKCLDLRYHKVYGRTATYIYRFWGTLANRLFNTGTEELQGKDRIYGFSPGPDNVLPLYKIYDLPPESGELLGGRPYALPVGMYPEPNSSQAAEAMLLGVDETMNSLSDSGTGLIISECWYNDPAVGSGFKSALDRIARGAYYLIQWPLSYSSSGGTMV